MVRKTLGAQTTDPREQMPKWLCRPSCVWNSSRCWMLGWLRICAWRFFMILFTASNVGALPTGEWSSDALTKKQDSYHSIWNPKYKDTTSLKKAKQMHMESQLKNSKNSIGKPLENLWVLGPLTWKSATPRPTFGRWLPLERKRNTPRLGPLC